MSGGFVDGLMELLGRRNLSKGIKGRAWAGGGCRRCGDHCGIWEIDSKDCRNGQSGVKRAIESMTGLKVTAGERPHTGPET